MRLRVQRGSVQTRRRRPWPSWVNGFPHDQQRRFRGGAGAGSTRWHVGQQLRADSGIGMVPARRRHPVQ